MRFAIMFLVAVLLDPALLEAQPKPAAPTLTRVHTVTIDPRQARHEVVLPEPAGPDEFARSFALRIVARRGNVVINRITVAYATGAQHFEERRIELDEGERTRPIDPRDAGPGQEGRVVTRLVIEIEPATDATDKVVLEIWSLQRAVEPSDGGGLRSGGGVDKSKFAEVQIYYGTTRKREADRTKPGKTRPLATFSGAKGDALMLGRAVVTVPIEREIGKLPRPEFDLVILRFALRQENPERDFTLDAVDVLSPEEFKAGVNRIAGAATAYKGQAFVFVHGYNTSFDDAIFRTAQLTHDLGFDGAPVAFSWPSKAGTLDYRYDLDMAPAAWRGLDELLELVASQPGVTSVNIVAHSMGSHPALQALSRRAEEAKRTPARGNLKLNELMLAAPDVSRSDFEEMAKSLKPIVKGGITLYASSKDKALILSRQFASGNTRAGDIPRSGPVYVPGVDTIDISEASGSVFGVNHNTFAERAPMIQDIARIIRESSRPPDKRAKAFEPVANAGKTYWKFKAGAAPTQ
jgi:esterase/lipase superfamily enzyme